MALGQHDQRASHAASQAQRKKRASRACLGCRIRKVRCDVVQSGLPCTNCRADAQPCVIPKRSRKHHLSSETPLQPLHFNAQTLPPPDYTAPPPRAPRRDSDEGNGALQASGGPTAPPIEGIPQYYSPGDERSQQLRRETPLDESFPITLNVAPPGDVSPTIHPPQAVRSRPPVFGDRRAAFIEPTNPRQVPDAGTNAAETFESTPQSNPTAHTRLASYPFLESDFISSIPPDDLDYLDRLGCFQLPQGNNLDELVRSYFLYIHPHLPLFDEGKFWETYFSHQPGTNGASRISLFVFQALLLVVCSLVPSSTIEDLGFPSVRAARAAYYRRAKALYDFEIERSILAKAQGALLMTFHVPLNEPQINAYWLKIAIHHARVEGADRYSTYPLKDSARHNQLKRLWWCCIIRDRTMGIGLRRSISIFSSSFDKVWPQLTPDDLENEMGHPCVHSLSVKLELVRSLLALCKLCAVLTNILPLLYPTDGVPVAEDRLDLLKRIYRYTDDLNQWQEATTSNIKPHEPQDKTHGIVILFTNILNIYFQSSKAALCNYRIMLTLDDPAPYSFERLQIKNELQETLRSIAQSLRAIVNAEMITYSPIGMVAFLALPSVCYNLNLHCRAPTPTSNKVSGTNIYQDFLRVLQLRYEGTDRALNNMSQLMSDMNLKDATSPSTARFASEHSLTVGQESVGTADGSIPMNSWSGIDIVISEPQKYVQMNYKLDFFLSRGRFPTRRDIPSNILSLPDESEESADSDLANDSAGGEASDAVVRTQQSQIGPSYFPSQDPISNPVWAASSPGSNCLAAPCEARAYGPELTSMLMDDPFSQGGIHPDGFSFEDFMTDGPSTGIERLQIMLNRYPGWQ